MFIILLLFVAFNAVHSVDIFINPVAGEIIPVYEPYTIRWTPDTGIPDSAALVEIELWHGNDQITNITDSASNTGTFTWTPVDIFGGFGNYFMAICPFEDDMDSCGYTNGQFSIAAALSSTLSTTPSISLSIPQSSPTTTSLTLQSSFQSSVTSSISSSINTVLSTTPSISLSASQSSPTIASFTSQSLFNSSATSSISSSINTILSTTPSISLSASQSSPTIASFTSQSLFNSSATSSISSSINIISSTTSPTSQISSSISQLSKPRALSTGAKVAIGLTVPSFVVSFGLAISFMIWKRKMAKRIAIKSPDRPASRDQYEIYKKAELSASTRKIELCSPDNTANTAEFLGDLIHHHELDCENGRVR